MSYYGLHQVLQKKTNNLPQLFHTTYSDSFYFFFSLFNAMCVLWHSSHSCFLINTADRIIRVYDGREILTCGRDGEPEPMQKLQDLVNR